MAVTWILGASVRPSPSAATLSGTTEHGGLRPGTATYNPTQRPRQNSKAVMVTDLIESRSVAEPGAATSPHETGRSPSVDQAGNPDAGGVGGDSEVAQRVRLVLDTSVLIADPTCVLEFRRRRRRCPPDRRGRTRRIEESFRRRRSRRTHRPADTRGDAGASRWITRRSGADRHRNHDAADRDQQHPSNTSSSNTASIPAVPDNRIIGAAIGQSELGRHDDGQQRCCTANQGSPPRGERSGTRSGPIRHAGRPDRMDHDRRHLRNDRLPLRGRRHRPRRSGRSKPQQTARERVRRLALRFTVGARAHRR